MPVPTHLLLADVLVDGVLGQPLSASLGVSLPTKRSAAPQATPLLQPRPRRAFGPPHYQRIHIMLHIAITLDENRMNFERFHGTRTIFRPNVTLL